MPSRPGPEEAGAAAGGWAAGAEDFVGVGAGFGAAAGGAARGAGVEAGLEPKGLPREPEELEEREPPRGMLINGRKTD